MNKPTVYQWRDEQPGGAWVDTDQMRQELIDDGVLVPVERCEHGMIDGHRVFAGRLNDHDTGEWCPGAGIGGEDE